MESPPSTSIWSDAFMLSEDSGLLLTSGSVSSGSMSGESRSGFGQLFEYEDCSSADSLEGMYGENFNTLKKGPHWTSPIEPPLEFQDSNVYERFAEDLAVAVLREAVQVAKQRRRLNLPFRVMQRTYWMPDFLPFSPCHGRPSSRSSLGSSRLSSSHNSLSVPTAHRADDSSFITQAVSHDTLTSNQISDLYNVPFDSDVYAIPVDTVKHQPPHPKQRNVQRRRRRNTASVELTERTQRPFKKVTVTPATDKRHSVAGASSHPEEPIHMTLQEVRQYLQTLYSSSSDSDRDRKPKNTIIINNKNSNASTQRKKSAFLINIKNKKVKDSCESIAKPQIGPIGMHTKEKRKKSPAKIFSLKQTLCNMFRFRRIISPERNKRKDEDELNYSENDIRTRALPPLPAPNENEEDDLPALDFATSIRKVKDYGWYWGPLSSEAAEKILSNEPDGSFIVRDSSDDHYIFSLTFKLNNSVRHVRIEHDQGNFSFGSCTKFKSQTIVEFIENAVEHSRSGRYLFFLHRRPTNGPVRVQLLHPVSRFKQTQSLQHLCRFVILKKVRKDLISSLPLPRRMIDYLSTPHYYSENLADEDCIDVDGVNVKRGESSEEYGSDLNDRITR